MMTEKNTLNNTQIASLIIAISLISALLVILRMKTVDLHYERSTMSKKINKLDSNYKDVRAQKARMLSIKNLRTLAKKYNLTRPGQEQIIVIP